MFPVCPAPQCKVPLCLSRDALWWIQSHGQWTGHDFTDKIQIKIFVPVMQKFGDKFYLGVGRSSDHIDSTPFVCWSKFRFR